LPPTYHPQTCGEIERFHQTLKRHLQAQRPAHSLVRLQAQIDRFIAYYNEQRPYRALQRRTPAEAYGARIKAKPQSNGHPPARHYRVRHDKVDAGGTVTLRYRSRLRHIAVGRANKGRRVVLLVADRDVRVLSAEGEILRQLVLAPQVPAAGLIAVSTMSRDICLRCLETSQMEPTGIEPVTSCLQSRRSPI
jgi:Integrase core domain